MNLRPIARSSSSRRRDSAWSPLTPIAPRSARAGSSSRPFGRARVSGALISCRPVDVGAERAELPLEPLVASIEVIDARDLGGPVGGEAGQHERGRRAKVGG